MDRNGWVRIIPFAVFMGFIGLQQALEWTAGKGWIALSEQQLLYIYPLKAIIVALLLLYYRRSYQELTWSDLKRFSQTGASVALGLLVFVLWINMDWEFASLGEAGGFNPNLVESNAVQTGLIGFRLFGAVLVVPVMEELFWRSFLLRYLVDANFMAVRIGTYSLSSFLIGSILFGLEHSLVLAGIMAGVAYSLLLYRSKSIAQCVLAHAVTNLALGIYVLQSGQWRFW